MDWADPTFDAAGNMTTIPQPGNLASSYAAKFDAWIRLVSLDAGSIASYEYDGLNRRVKRVEGSSTRHFYYNERWQVLEERATESGTGQKQFVWGANYVDELVLRYRDADANSGNGLEESLYALQVLFTTSRRWSIHPPAYKNALHTGRTVSAGFSTPA